MERDFRNSSQHAFLLRQHQKGEPEMRRSFNVEFKKEETLEALIEEKMIAKQSSDHGAQRMFNQQIGTNAYREA